MVAGMRRVKKMRSIKRLFSKKAPESAKQCAFPIACVVMASGQSERFGQQNKLLSPFRGRPLLESVLECFSQLDCCARNAIVRHREAALLADSKGFTVVWNNGPDHSTARTIAYGIFSAPDEAVGCLFAVGDQPLLTPQSVRRLCDRFMEDPTRIVSLSWRGARGNPTIFPRELFSELVTLDPEESGRSVIARHPQLLTLVEAQNAEEMIDVDTQEDLEAWQ